jgi:hypothetical protein
LSQIAERYQGDLYKVANIRDIENVLREMPKNKGTTLPDASKWFLFGGIILFLVALFQKPYKMVEM